MNKNTVEVPKDILKGLFRIVSGIPGTMGGFEEVYQEAIPNMRDAYKWVLEYGRKHNIDDSGYSEYQKNHK